MKIRTLKKLSSVLALAPMLASAQGTFQYDQQSSDESNGGSGAVVIQQSQPTGQSFTPTLNGIGFVRLNLFDETRNNGVGAVLYVNLRSDSLTGAIIDSTAPVSLPDNFGLQTPGFVDFFFSGNVEIQPGVKYYLQPVVQSGDLLGLFAGSFGYPGGDLYNGGVAFSSDYWFREGVIVPEPSGFALITLGAGLLWLKKSRKAKDQ